MGFAAWSAATRIDSREAWVAHLTDEYRGKYRTSLDRLAALDAMVRISEETGDYDHPEDNPLRDDGPRPACESCGTADAGAVPGPDRVWWSCTDCFVRGF